MRRRFHLSRAWAATGAAAAVMLAGALMWFLPYLSRQQEVPAGVPVA